MVRFNFYDLWPPATTAPYLLIFCDTFHVRGPVAGIWSGTLRARYVLRHIGLGRSNGGVETGLGDGWCLLERVGHPGKLDLKQSLSNPY